MITLPNPLTDHELRVHLEAMTTNGYTILEKAVDSEFIAALVAEIERLAEVRPGGDIPPAPFTGQVTRRWFDLLNERDIWQSVATHPWVMQIQQEVLGEGFLLSTMGTAVVGPGEVAQPIHADDVLYGFPRPHPTIVCNTMWSISEFTEENGATRIVPGSHKWDEDPDFWEPYESVPASMPPGSICMFVGTLYHGAGANQSGEDRLGLTINYCAGSMRQQENLMLGVGAEKMMAFPRELQDMLGFKICNGAGHIFAQDPRAELERKYARSDEGPYSERRNALHRERMEAFAKMAAA